MQQVKMKNWMLVVGVIVAFLLGIWATRWFFQQPDTVTDDQATVLLQQIKEVTKLVTVEGHFSEIYKHEEYYGYDLDMFRKKALIRVQAKVLVGYDLEKMKIASYPDRKTFVISELPPAEIMAIEHDLDYYDIQEGLFNSFSTADYNRLNAKAKDFVKQKAQESNLFDSAQRQRNKVFGMIKVLVETAGWKLEVEGVEGFAAPDSLLIG